MKKHQTKLPIDQSEFCANPRCLLSKSNRVPELALHNETIGERVKVAGYYFCRSCAGAALMSAMAESRWLQEFQRKVLADVRATYDIETNMHVRSVERSLIDDALEATAELLRTGDGEMITRSLNEMDFDKGQFATAFLKLVAVMQCRNWTLKEVLVAAGELVGAREHPLLDAGAIERLLGAADTSKKLSDALNKIRALSPRFLTEVEKVREVEPMTEDKPALVEFLVKVRME